MTNGDLAQGCKHSDLSRGEINAGNIKALIVSGANPLRSYAGTKAMKTAFEKLELLVVFTTAGSGKHW